MLIFLFFFFFLNKKNIFLLHFSFFIKIEKELKRSSREQDKTSDHAWGVYFF